MNSRNLGALAVVAAGGAMAAYALLRPTSEAPGGAADPQNVPAVVERVAAEPEIVANNAMTAIKLEDERKTRGFEFEAGKAGFKAEGVEINAAGEMKLTSQFTGGSIESKLVSARAVGSAGERTLERNKESAARATKADKLGSVRFDEFFAGVDLEYRYDGKDVEEFFHVSDALKSMLIGQGEDLVVTTLVPGLFRKNGDFLNAGSDTRVDTSKLKQDERPLELQEVSDTVVVAGTVELNTAGHRFGLPAAYAVDERGQPTTLQRRFTWTPAGLEVATILPHAWTKAAQGRIMIDPSVVDGARAVELKTWNNEQGFVKDSRGDFHVGYTAVYSGRWVVTHAVGTNTPGQGVTWNTPRVVQPNYGPDENRHYAPFLRIDSQDRLHVMWGDHGHIPSQAAAKGGYSSWGHRVRYASCEARCQSGTWTPSDLTQQLITVQAGIAPTAAVHQSYYSLAVDQQDRVHITFAEWGNIAARHRYFQRDTGGIVEKAGIGWNDIHSQIIVDNNNQVHYLGSDYWGNYDVKHYVWDRPSETWSVRPNMVPRDTGGNGGRMFLRELSAVVDSGNNIHVAVNAYDNWDLQTYHIWYGRYESASQAWAEVQEAYAPTRGVHNYSPSITVDANNLVHLVWHRQLDPNNQLMYATKQAGQAWSAERRLLFSTGTQYTPVARPRLSWPTGPNQTVVAGVIDVLVVENGSEIQYLSTGAPVEGPVPATPVDHTFISNTRPTFEWRRIGPDNGSNITYTLQVAPTPTFPMANTVEVAAGTAVSYQFTGAGPELVADGQYRYWRLRATNQYGSGPWGPIFELGVDTTPPAAFNLLTPANNSDPGTRTPRFTWQAAQD